MESSEFEMILSIPLSGRIVNKIVQETNKLKSSVYLVKNNRTVNMKTILGILSLDLENPITLVYPVQVYEEVESKFKPWVVNK